jgi:hypothetical protein
VYRPRRIKWFPFIEANCTVLNRKLVMLLASCVAAVSIAACASAITTRNAKQGSVPAVSLREVDGGPSYYARFSHSLPSGASYFPIGVWFESVISQADVDKDKDAGLNLYVVLTANSNLNLVRDNGMFYAAGGDIPDDPSIRARFVADEVDMTHGPGAGYDHLNDVLASLPPDGRARYANYGKGVAFWETDAEAARFVNDFQDIVSVDTYWFTDNNICSQTEGGGLLAGGMRPLSAAECHRAANYGATVRRVRDLVSPAGSKPVWAFVEVGHPFSESDWPSIQPAEVRAAVWQSLIAGARGIIYFNHSIGGPNPSQHVLRDPAYAAVRDAVRTTNRQITDLAPVLNGPTLVSGWSQEAGTTAMVKWANGHFYVFAGSAGSAVSGRFSLPCVGDARAAVVGEGRSIPVSGGSFTDSFGDGNAVHIYRIDGGSTCGLPQPPSGSPPPNGFTFGKLKRNPRKGTAKLTVRVSGPGALRLKKTSRVRGASKRAAEVGTVRLQIRPRGEARRRLERVGKRKRTSRVKVTARVRYRPTGGEPSKKSKRVTLKRRDGRR